METTKDSYSAKSKKLKDCHRFICAAIAMDLLQSEFSKPREKQTLSNFSLYINLIIDLAKHEEFIDRQLETLFLSPNGMNVSSDYFYLVSNMLRLKVSSGNF